MNDVKALRGMWGSNRGPKLSRKEKKERKIQTVKLDSENSERVKGWKANR